MKIAKTIDGLVAALAPRVAVKRAKARALLRYYEAAQPSNYHKALNGGGASADATVAPAADKLRTWSRYLDENHDLAIGIFDTLVNRIVGEGLTVEPVPRRRNGKLIEGLARDLRELWELFWRWPEASRQLPGPELERLVCRSWLRDGDKFIHHVLGTDAAIRHASEVSYSLELLEADYVPMLLTQDNIVNGIEMNAWKQPTFYHVYRDHPGDMNRIGLGTYRTDTKPVPAQYMSHLKFARRTRQTRGVPIIHGVINRLDNIRDYEESESIAARVTAAFSVWIERNPELALGGLTAEADGTIPFEMQSGMIVDGLAPGEKPVSVGMERPNPELSNFRNAMLRAVASGSSTSYSSISKDYNGTYSAQRQELVESVPGYNKLRQYFIAVGMKPIWRNFTSMAISQGLIKLPKGVTPDMVANAVEIRGPGLPWIDPKKEIEADILAIDNGIKSRHQVIRERNGDPAIVDMQIAADTFEKPAKASTDTIPTSEQDQQQEQLDMASGGN